MFSQEAQLRKKEVYHSIQTCAIPSSSKVPHGPDSWPHSCYIVDSRQLDCRFDVSSCKTKFVPASDLSLVIGSQTTCKPTRMISDLENILVRKLIAPHLGSITSLIVELMVEFFRKRYYQRSISGCDRFRIVPF